MVYRGYRFEEQKSSLSGAITATLTPGSPCGRLSLQLGCLVEGRVKQRGQWRMGICMLQKSEMFSSAPMVMGKTEQLGLPLVNVFLRSDGLLCQCVGFAPNS